MRQKWSVVAVLDFEGAPESMKETVMGTYWMKWTAERARKQYAAYPSHIPMHYEVRRAG